MTTEGASKSDISLLAMINNVLSGKSPVLTRAREEQTRIAEVPITNPPAAPESKPAIKPESGPADQSDLMTGRRRLTVEQMEGVIRKVLAELLEFGSGEGIRIIVYGFYPWNALLLFEANAVSSSDAKAIKQAMAIAVETLRQDYDVVMPTH